MILLPTPRQLTPAPGHFAIKSGPFIRVATPDLLPAARAIQHAAGCDWHLIAGEGGPQAGVAARLALDTALPHPQAYRLTITPEAIDLLAASPAAAFHGAQTLAQLLRQHPTQLPCLRIDDWPDFPVRGVMLDISRDKVPTMATLFALVNELAGLKINQLQLYTEHTFAYRAHPVVWAEASPMTGEDILSLDAYCRERFIELVPNQNSFGHLERWLKHPEYLPLAEAPDGYDSPWGRRDGPFSLCPTDPRSLELVAGLYEELLPHFSSRMFNVGCDETFDIGQGRSKAAVEARGRERVYLDFLLEIHRLVTKHGRRMQFWGDIILHRPELIPELPRDVIALEWGYEANHPFDRDGELFAQAGIPFYVCPGTSSWCSIAGRTDNAIGNLKSAAENGLKHGASGYLITDWGDWGHLQYLPVSYLGFAAGAAYAWCHASNRDMAIAAALDRHVFRDAGGIMGKLAYDLGNVYQRISKNRNNSTVLFWRLAGGKAKEWEGVPREEYDAAERAIDEAMGRLDEARMDRADAALVADEFRNAAAMLRRACRRGRGEDSATERSQIMAEHRRLWLARNRVGGLADSTRRLEAPL